MSNRNDFMAGFIIGGLLGTAVALLLAPRPGAEVRHRLTDSADDLRERADEVIKKIRGTAEELTQRGRATLDESATRLREVVERGVGGLEEKARGVRRQDGESTEA